MLAVMLLVSLACKCALSWLLLHYLFFSAWPVTHLSYPAGRQPSGVLLGVLAPSPISLYFVVGHFQVSVRVAEIRSRGVR